jgi:hypothetical protein
VKTATTRPFREHYLALTLGGFLSRRWSLQLQQPRVADTLIRGGRYRWFKSEMQNFCLRDFGGCCRRR